MTDMEEFRRRYDGRLRAGGVEEVMREVMVLRRALELMAKESLTEGFEFLRERRLTTSPENLVKRHVALARTQITTEDWLR